MKLRCYKSSNDLRRFNISHQLVLFGSRPRTGSRPCVCLKFNVAVTKEKARLLVTCFIDRPIWCEKTHPPRIKLFVCVCSWHQCFSGEISAINDLLLQTECHFHQNTDISRCYVNQTFLHFNRKMRSFPSHRDVTWKLLALYLQITSFNIFVSIKI